MTDLERVRELTARYFDADEIAALIAAHLKEDAEKHGKWMAAESAADMAEAQLRAERNVREQNRLYVERYERVEAELTNKVTQLTELREAVEKAYHEMRDDMRDEDGCCAVVRQLIEEKK